MFCFLIGREIFMSMTKEEEKGFFFIMLLFIHPFVNFYHVWAWWGTSWSWNQETEKKVELLKCMENVSLLSKNWEGVSGWKGKEVLLRGFRKHEMIISAGDKESPCLFCHLRATFYPTNVSVVYSSHCHQKLFILIK